MGRKLNFLYLLSALPILFLAYVVVRYSVNIPFLDQWEFVPILDDFYSGRRIDFEGMFAQQNEHRFFFPRMIMFILAILSFWDLRLENYFSLAIAIVIFLVLAKIIRDSFKKLDITFKPWHMFILSGVIFSLNQWTSWFWGQIQFFLNVLTFILGIWLLTARKVTFARLVSATLFGIVSSFSLGSGLLFWLIGGLILFTRRVSNFYRRLWVLVTLIVFLVYSLGYHKPPEHPPLFALLDQPLEFLKYIFVYIGAPLSTFNTDAAFVFGIMGSVLYVVTLRDILASRQIRFRDSVTVVGISLYAPAAALFTAVGRAGFGAVQATSNRYVTISQLFWIGLIYLLLVKRYKLAKSISQLVLIGAILLFIIVSSTHGFLGLRDHSAILNEARLKILTDKSSEISDDIYNYLYKKDGKQTVIERLEILRHYSLSLF